MGYTRDEKTGLYNIKGDTYQKIRGSRTQVMNGTAYMTTGELTKNQLVYSKEGYIVSKKSTLLRKMKCGLKNMVTLPKRVNLVQRRKKKSKGRSRSEI